MKKVNIKFVDVFDEGKSFGDCLNDLLEKYYTTEDASASSVESVDKVDTLLDGDAARKKFDDFLTALHPRQYHPCTPQPRLLGGVSLLMSFFDAPVAEKTKMRHKAAYKINYKIFDRLHRGCFGILCFLFSKELFCTVL